VDSSLTLLNPPYAGYQRNFVEWIKRSESTKKRKVSRFKLLAGKTKENTWFHPVEELKWPDLTGQADFADYNKCAIDLAKPAELGAKTN